MAHSRQTTRSVIFRPFVAVLMAAVLAVLPLVGTAQDASPVASPEAAASVAGELNLPAMALTPADLEALGLPGFGKFNNGFFSYFDFFAGSLAFFTGKPEDEVRAFYEGIGWRREYRSYLGVPAVPDNPDSESIRGAWGNVTEYADAAGAEAALADQGNATDSTPWTIDRFATSRSFGDGSAIVRASIPADGDFPGQQEFTVFFRVGNLLANAGFATNIDLSGDGTPAAATPATDGAEPTSPAGTVAEIEALAGRLLERIEATLAAADPGLAPLALRLDNPESFNIFAPEGYVFLDGDLRPYYGGSESDILATREIVTTAEAIYEIEQVFQPGEEPAPTDGYHLLRLFRFADEGTASAFLQAFPAALSGVDDVVGADVVADIVPGEATGLGDESLAVAIDIETPDGPIQRADVYVRVGSTVAAVTLESQTRPDLALVEDLAAAQAACLEAGSECGTVPAPIDAFVAPTATPAAATPAASPVAGAAPVEFLWQAGVEVAPFEQAVDVTVAPDGTVWVVDRLTDRIHIFDPDGTLVETWGTSGSGEGEFNFGDYGAVAHDAAGNIYVLDSDNNRVQVFGPDRAFVTAWGEFGGTEDGEFVAASDIAVDAEGNVYVLDAERRDLQKFAPDGAFLGKISPTGPDGRFEAPARLGAGPDGYVYVPDGPLVYVFAPDGSLVRTLGSENPGEGDLGFGIDAAADAAGNVYVSDVANSRIVVFGPTGEIVGTWGEEGSADGQFVEVDAVALDGTGHVYILDYGNNRIQAFRLLPPLAASA